MISVSEYELILGARLAVLNRAIGALIITHPDPARFADLFGKATGIAQIQHITAPKASDAVKQAASDYARELLGVAHDEVARRLLRKADED